MRTPPMRSFSQVGACVTSVTRSSKSARSTVIETRSDSAMMRSRRFGFSGRAGREELLERSLRRAARVSFSTNAARSSNRIWRPAIVAQ
jgi:hypothetical protein